MPGANGTFSVIPSLVVGRRGGVGVVAALVELFVVADQDRAAECDDGGFALGEETGCGATRVIVRLDVCCPG